MKDIKSFLIGFLTCCCLFLIMGQTDGEKLKSYETYLEVEKGNVTIEANENGRYQGFANSHNVEYMLDTTTGELFDYHYLSEKHGGSYWRQLIEPKRKYGKKIKP